MSINKLFEITIEQYKIMYKLEELSSSHDLPASFNRLIDGEVSNHEFVWEMIDMVINHMGIPDFLEKTEKLCSDAEYMRLTGLVLTKYFPSK